MITSIISGSLLLSLLHAVIPNHWLPIIAIGKKEGWPIQEVMKVTFLAALAHAASTILIGIFLSFLGSNVLESAHHIMHLIGPCLLIVLGLYFIYRHHKHKHFHIDDRINDKKSKTTIVTALVIAMFFSPCMEIEAYFLLAGAESWWLVWFIAAMYFLITTSGMLLLVRYAYKGLLRLNWHSLEHKAGIITGITLIITGIISFFI
jgi:putative Mn2+ efflux pump MntP